MRFLRSFTVGFMEWYHERKVRQIRLWGGIGFVVGYTFGRIGRIKRQLTAEFGDHTLITEYSVLREKSEEFERAWSEKAKTAQNCRGYRGTKLFKVLDRDWPTQTPVVKQDIDMSKFTKTVTEPPVSENPLTVTQGGGLLPCQYVELRGWLTVEAEKMWKAEERVQQLSKELESICINIVEEEYATLADDSIRRLIH